MDQEILDAIREARMELVALRETLAAQMATNTLAIVAAMLQAQRPEVGPDELLTEATRFYMAALRKDVEFRVGHVPTPSE